MLDVRARSASIPAYSAAPSFDFIPALDGFRAVSIALVIISHVGLEHLVPGIFGVTVFFFVSGFLITRQLIAELNRTGQIALDKFYIRRMLRLYPALLTAIVLGGVLYVLLGGVLKTSDVAAAILYGSNYWGMSGGFESTLPGVPHPYGILWSLAVEEHYYLVFPFVVLLAGRRPLRLAALLAAGVAIITGWRCFLALHCTGPAWDDYILHATDTRIDSILYGALLATLLGSRIGPPLLKALRSPASPAIGLVLIGASLAIRDPLFRNTLRFSAQGVGLFFGVGAVLFGATLKPLRTILASTPARLLGRWSYSLYLWHWIVLMIATSMLPEAMREPLLGGGLPIGECVALAVPVALISIGAAAASHQFAERPVLALRRRFGSHAGSGETVSAQGRVVGPVALSPTPSAG